MMCMGMSTVCAMAVICAAENHRGGLIPDLSAACQSSRVNGGITNVNVGLVLRTLDLVAQTLPGNRHKSTKSKAPGTEYKAQKTKFKVPDSSAGDEGARLHDVELSLHIRPFDVLFAVAKDAFDFRRRLDQTMDDIIRQHPPLACYRYLLQSALLVERQ